MVEPDFIIGGGQRCGTTTLYKLLDQHPQIYLAKPIHPEPKFFVHEPCPGRDRPWYLETWFADVPDVIAVGEKSTSYLETPAAPARIKAMFPAMRAVFILRHPIERAISNYRFTRAHGLEPETFDRAVQIEASRLANTQFDDISAHPHAYLRRSRFADHLERYREVFRREEIEIVLNNQLQQNEGAVGRKLYEFLNVDTTFQPPRLAVRENAHAPDDLTIARGTVDNLLDYFAEPNRRLSEMFDLDLSGWNRPTPMIESLVRK